MSGERILIVEDEREIAELLHDYLEIERFEPHVCREGEEALRLFESVRPGLVILDIMLPRMDGMDVCRHIRSRSDVPILMLSAKKLDSDKILGLGLGADDYVVKPFSPGEVVARVKALLRRYAGFHAVSETREKLRFHELEVDLKAHEVRVGGEPVHFSAKEFELLRALALHPHQVFTREQLFERCWGPGEYGDMNTVTVHVKKIREKIEADPSRPRHIVTVRGVGYKFAGGRP